VLVEAATPFLHFVRRMKRRQGQERQEQHQRQYEGLKGANFFCSSQACLRRRIFSRERLAATTSEPEETQLEEVRIVTLKNSPVKKA
jgi:hypothetical protein